MCGRGSCEVPRALVPESDSNFMRRNCETQSTYMWEVKQDVWRRYLLSSKSYSARIRQKLFKEELWNSECLHVRSQERCTGRDTFEFPRATVPESGGNFVRRNCDTESFYTWEVSNAVWKRYLCSSCRIFLRILLQMLKKSMVHCIKSAPKPCETTSKVHQSDVVSKAHQNCIKSAPKVHHYFWTLLHIFCKNECMPK